MRVMFMFQLFFMKHKSVLNYLSKFILITEERNIQIEINTDCKINKLTVYQFQNLRKYK